MTIGHKSFGIRCGNTKNSAPADITVIDPNLVWTVDKNRFFKGKNTPQRMGTKRQSSNDST